jgi:transposase
MAPQFVKPYVKTNKHDAADAEAICEAVLRAERNLNDQSWLRRLIGRCNKNVAAVALANKNARIVWALLVKDERFRSDYATA